MIYNNVNEYIEAYSDPENALLKKLNRDTQAKILYGRMVSGHIQGKLLEFITKMIQPKNILEIGTFTGYSALCFAEGLNTEGFITTIDINEELEDFTQSFFNQSPHKDKIKYIIGNALEVIPTLNEMYDLVFIDADKENYPKYYDLVFEKIPVGGFIIADNVIWGEKVLNADKYKDKETKGVVEFNNKIISDNRVENFILPLRDGLNIIRKIK